jgi:WD40 repeat protein
LPAIRFSSDGEQVISASHNEIQSWTSQKDGKPVRTIKSANRLQDVESISPDGRNLAVKSQNTISLIQAEGIYTSYSRAQENEAEGWSYAVNADSQTVAAVKENTVKRWKFDGVSPLLPLSARLENDMKDISQLSFSPNGQTIAAIIGEKAVQIWRANSVPRIVRSNAKVVSISLSANALAMATDKQQIEIHPFDGQHSTLPHTSSISKIHLSPDGKMLAIADSEAKIQFISLSGERQPKQIETDQALTSIQLSPDGSLLASASLDTIKLWDMNNSRLLWTIQASENQDMSFSKDSKMLVSVAEDGTVTQWDLDFDRLIQKGCEWLKDYLDTHPDAPQVCAK